MESNLPLDSDIHALEITSESREYLLTAAKWGRFLAIVGLVFMGLMLLIFLFMGGTVFSAMNEMQGGAGVGALGTTFWIIYFMFVFGLTIPPLYYLYSFSTKTIQAINSSNTEDLTDGIKNLKSFFKFYGILTAIMVGIYGLLFIGGLLVGAMS